MDHNSFCIRSSNKSRLLSGLSCLGPSHQLECHLNYCCKVRLTIVNHEVDILLVCHLQELLVGLLSLLLLCESSYSRLCLNFGKCLSGFLHLSSLLTRFGLLCLFLFGLIPWLRVLSKICLFGSKVT